MADAVSPVLYDHFRKERWGGIDLVLSAGDVPPEYLDFLASSLDVPLFYVRGNHDWSYEASRYGGTDVHGRIVTYRGLTIAGFEGSPRYNQGKYQYTDWQVSRLAARTRVRSLWQGRPDIVLTHAPPLGIHDGSDPAHRGFRALRTLIQALNPRYLVHGHVHQYQLNSGRDVVVGCTTVVNAYPYRELQLAVASDDAM